MTHVPKKIIAVLIFIGLILVAVIISFFRGTPDGTPTTLFPTPTPIKTSRTGPVPVQVPFQKTVIGQTTDEQVNALGSILDKKTLPDGSINYKLISVNPMIPDEIITQNGVVVFEKISTFTRKEGGFSKISSFTQKQGSPDEQITGSKVYGEHATIYLYPEIGYALIGNANTDETYEIMRFTPISLEEFKTKYPSYIQAADFTEHL